MTKVVFIHFHLVDHQLQVGDLDDSEALLRWNSNSYNTSQTRKCCRCVWTCTAAANHMKIICECCQMHRCRRRKNFGRAKDFCPNFPKLAGKILPKMTSKKRLNVLLGTSSAVFQDFDKFFKHFVQMSTYFSRIFTKSKLLWVRLHPMHPCFLHHWSIDCY